MHTKPSCPCTKVFGFFGFLFFVCAVPLPAAVCKYVCLRVVSAGAAAHVFALLDEHLPDHCVFEHKEKKMVHSMFREVLEGKQSSTGGDRGNKKMVRAHDRV